MERPCVRVSRERGETARQTLAEAGLIDRRFALESDGEWVYIPVRDPDAVPAEYTVCTREVTERDDQTLPEDDLSFSPTYERLGSLALLQESDPKRARAAADAIMASDLPIEGVLNRASPVMGTERVPEWEVLAGDTTETIHREYGATFLVDPTKVYFSPRLATERERVISQVSAGECVFDMFAGAGPYAVRAAMAGATVVAADINPAAVRYCRENARRNDVEDQVTVIEGDVREVAETYVDWADRLVMNLPHSAAEFLDTAATLAGEVCRVHYYDIQPADAPFDVGEAAIRTAFEPEYTVTIATRREVRSYSPTEVNVCLDVDLEQRH